jgi:sec-independent protein translocase protein TatA
MNSPLSLPLAVWGLGGSELLLILIILLVLFGGSKLPSLARGLGQSIKEFKKASNEAEQEEKAASTSTSTPPKPAAEPTKTHGSN